MPYTTIYSFDTIIIVMGTIFSDSFIYMIETDLTRFLNQACHDLDIPTLKSSVLGHLIFKKMFIILLLY